MLLLPVALQLPISRIRYIAISATIQNSGDVAEWLQVQPQGLMVFGEETRPVKLTTVVKGYAQVSFNSTFSLAF